MSSDEGVTQLLRSGIPLSAAAGIEVIDVGPEQVTVQAPFDENRNYHGTVFGGSLAVVAIVTGWVTVDSMMREADEPADVVIQSSHMDYLAPVTAAFEATAPRPDDWRRFLSTFARFGKARTEVTSELTSAGELVARHVGVYAALRR